MDETRQDYRAVVQHAAEVLSKESFPAFILSLEESLGNVEAHLETDVQIDNHLRSLMETHWHLLVDTTNAYWEWEQVTAEDKQFVFRRLKRDVAKEMELIYHQMLLERWKQEVLDYQKYQQEMKSYQTLCETPPEQVINPERLLQMKVCVDHLLSKANIIAKIRHVMKDAVFPILNAGIAEGSLPDPESLAAAGMEWGKGLPAADESVADKHFPLHEFERKLRGGFVASVKPSGTFVPETVIRQLGIDHGDLLKIEKKYSRHGTRYTFDLVQKNNKPQPERKQINFCVIKKDALLTYAEQYWSSSGLSDIRMDGVPYRFVIKEDDVRGFKLEVDDMVDIAYWENNPLSNKVIWKHHVANGVGMASITNG